MLSWCIWNQSSKVNILIVRFALKLIYFESEDGYFKNVIVVNYYIICTCAKFCSTKILGVRGMSLVAFTVLYDRLLFYISFHNFVLLVFPSCHSALHTGNWPMNMWNIGQRFCLHITNINYFNLRDIPQRILTWINTCYNIGVCSSGNGLG